MKVFVLENSWERIKTFKFFFEMYNPSIEVDYAETAREGIYLLSQNTYTHLFFDHDLDNFQETGMDVCEFLRDNPDNPNNKAVIVIHSMNIAARPYMRRCFEEAYIHPWSCMTVDDLKGYLEGNYENETTSWTYVDQDFQDSGFSSKVWDY